MRNFFEGEHIVIRKARMTDLDAIFENVYGDRELLSTMFLRISEDKEEAAARLERTIEFQKDKMLFFVAKKDTDEAIGLCGIRREREGIYSEAGLAIARKYQGRGYGKEMLSLLLNYAFEELHAERFAYYCMVGNDKSRCLAKHFGFQFDSASPEIREYDKKEFLVERYILTKDEYNTMK